MRFQFLYSYSALLSEDILIFERVILPFGRFRTTLVLNYSKYSRIYFDVLCHASLVPGWMITKSGFFLIIGIIWCLRSDIVAHWNFRLYLVLSFLKNVSHQYHLKLNLLQWNMYQQGTWWCCCPDVVCLVALLFVLDIVSSIRSLMTLTFTS